MTERITADILVEAHDLALPDFADLRDRIVEAASTHKATVTVDGRRYLAVDAPDEQPAVTRAEILLAAADALDDSERLRDLTDDHMHDVNAAANELRRMAGEQQ